MQITLVRGSYLEATLAMRERRVKRPLSLAVAPQASPSGALNHYED